MAANAAISVIGGEETIAPIYDAPTTPSCPPPQLARAVQEEIFEDKLTVAAVEGGAASATPHLAVNGLRPGLDLDDLIQRVAVRALEEFRPDHGRLPTPLLRLRVLRWINAEPAYVSYVTQLAFHLRDDTKR